MATLTTTTYAQLQKCIELGNPMHPGDTGGAKYLRALQGLFDKFSSELRQESRMAGDSWTVLDIEIEGEACEISHYAGSKGYNLERWAICKKPVPMSADKAASQQARLARMFNNAK